MIKYSIRGENIEVTEALRDYVESKLIFSVFPLCFRLLNMSAILQHDST